MQVIDWNPKENNLFTDIKIGPAPMESDYLVTYFLVIKDQLNLNVEFKEMRINWLVPFFQKKISEIDGFNYGRLRIEGRLDNPEFDGQASLSKGVATVDYLNTNYKFSGITIFDQNIIYFDDVKYLTDLDLKALSQAN